MIPRVPLATVPPLRRLRALVVAYRVLGKSAEKITTQMETMTAARPARGEGAGR